MGTRNRGIGLVNNSALDANFREPDRRGGKGAQSERKEAQHIPLLLWRQEPPLEESCAFTNLLAIPVARSRERRGRSVWKLTELPHGAATVRERGLIPIAAK